MMKKAVTLFSFLAMFLMVSCFSATEPEEEAEPLILAERAGIYKATTTTPARTDKTVDHTLMLDKSGEGFYAATGTTTTNFLLVGVGGESKVNNFYALEIVGGASPTKVVATVTFYADYPSKVTYDTDPTATDSVAVDLIKMGS